MQFRDIIGQPEVKQQLAELVQHNRLSHALLFLGKEGSGALQLALAFAQYIVCQSSLVIGHSSIKEPSLFGEPESQGNNDQPPMTNDSCGACPACKKANELIHPDIHFS